jgi:ABC-type multidrug transport system ATPase subunit
MYVLLDQIGKRYQFKWIIKGMTLEIPKGGRLAIKGHNGSGKSTVIKLLSGYLSPSSGSVKWMINEQRIDRENVFQHIALAAPYMDLVAEFTVKEMISFHCRSKGITSQDEIIEFCYLKEAADVQVQFLSSGMLQRLKLGLALKTPASFYLFDEPGTNLDNRGQEWFKRALELLPEQATVVVASNAEADFADNSTFLQMPYVK